MKKKFFAMYALVGALVASPVFTSCVDDSVSPSVEAIRNAKAEQLKALAELSKADAIYKQAETAYKQAETEYKQNQTAEAKAKFVYEIEKIKAEYEYYVMQYKANKAMYENTLKTNENSIITSAVSRYTAALDQVNLLNEKLVNAKLDLAQVGIDSARNVALLNKIVAEQNQIIAEKTAAIERIKAYEGESYEDLKKKVEALDAAANNLNSEKKIADDAKTKAQTAYSEAETAYNNNLEYVKAITTLKASTTATPAGYGLTITEEKDNYDVYSATTLTPTQYVKSYSALLESQVLKKTQDLNTALTTAKDNLGTPKDGDKAATKAYDILEALEAAVKAAKDGMALETPTHTQADVDAAELLLAQYKDDVTPRDFDATVAGNENSLAYLLKQVADAEKAIEDFNALVAAVKEGSDEHKEWVAAQEALLAAAEAYNEAYDKSADLQKAITANSTEKALLNSLMINDSKAEVEIAKLEADIAVAKAKIEQGLGGMEVGHEVVESISIPYWDATVDEDGDGTPEGAWKNKYVEIRYWVVDYYTSELSDEDLKALAEAEIADIEAKLAVQKQLLAKYEAELQALLATEEEA